MFNCVLSVYLLMMMMMMMMMIVAPAAAAAGAVTKSESDAEPKPRALHKTQSIFLRNLAATITHQEVEAVSS